MPIALPNLPLNLRDAPLLSSFLNTPKMRFLLLFLLAVGLFSACTEEVSTSFVEPPMVEEPTIEASNFTFRVRDYSVNHAYISSQKVSLDEEYFHHLVLTSSDVYVNNDLRGSSQAIVINFRTRGSSIVGNHPLIREGADRYTAIGVLGYGGKETTEFPQQMEADNGRLSQGLLRIEEDGDGYIIDVDFGSEYQAEDLKGQYVGPIIPLTLPKEEVANPELFQGPNEFSYYGVKHDLNYAYLLPMENHPSNELWYYLYLSTEEIVENNVFVGSSDLLMLVVSSNGELLDGTVAARGESRTYQEEVHGKTVQSAFYCKGLNFTTGAAEADESVETISATVETQGENFLIHFSSAAISGDPVLEGRFRGALQVID